MSQKRLMNEFSALSKEKWVNLEVSTARQLEAPKRSSLDSND